MKDGLFVLFGMTAAFLIGYLGAANDCLECRSADEWPRCRPVENAHVWVYDGKCWYSSHEPLHSEDGVFLRCEP